jgi:DNA-binding NarL/FixJ family response regulator
MTVAKKQKKKLIAEKKQKRESVPLTQREQQTLEAILQNKNIAQIAIDLSITEKTVCFYLTNIASKIKMFVNKIMINENCTLL